MITITASLDDARDALSESKGRERRERRANMIEILAAVVMGLAPALLVPRRTDKNLGFLLCLLVFPASFWLLRGNPLGLLASSGGLIILLVAGGLYHLVSSRRLRTVS